MIDRNEFEAQLSSPGENWRLTPERLVAIIELEEVRTEHGLQKPAYVQELQALLGEVIASEMPGIDLADLV